MGYNSVSTSHVWNDHTLALVWNDEVEAWGWQTSSGYFIVPFDQFFDFHVQWEETDGI